MSVEDTPDEAWQQFEALSLLVQAEQSQQHVIVAGGIMEVLLPARCDHVLYPFTDCDGILVAKLRQLAEQVDQHADHQCSNHPL